MAAVCTASRHCSDFSLFDRVSLLFIFLAFFLAFFVKAVVYFVYVFLIKVTTPKLDIVFFFLGTV